MCLNTTLHPVPTKTRKVEGSLLVLFLRSADMKVIIQGSQRFANTNGTIM